MGSYLSLHPEPDQGCTRNSDGRHRDGFMPVSAPGARPGQHDSELATSGLATGRQYDKTQNAVDKGVA